LETREVGDKFGSGEWGLKNGGEGKLPGIEKKPALSRKPFGKNSEKQMEGGY